MSNSAIESNQTHTSYLRLSDTELLGKLVGVRQARKLYQGSLSSVFTSEYDQGAPHERCLVARELVKRWLVEEVSSKKTR